MSEERMRIDKWLWHARFYRTRALAQEAAERGHIRVNGQRVVKAGLGLKFGDTLTLPLGREVLVVTVKAFSARRGDAAQARNLYQAVSATASQPLDPDATSP